MSAPIFPDEPIRVGPSAEDLAAHEREAETFDDYDPDARSSCMSCGGDGYVWCDGDEPMCPEADDSGCYMHHTIVCWNCRGTGAAKDQWFW